MGFSEELALKITGDSKDAQASVQALADSLKSAFTDPAAALDQLGEKILTGLTNPLVIAGAAAGVTIGTLVVLTSTLVDMAEHAAATGDHLGDVALKMHDSVEAVSALGAAFTAAGGSFDQLGSMSAMLQKRLEDNFTQVSEGLAKLGIDAQTFAAASPTEQILELSDAFRNLPPGVNQSAAAFEVLGRQGMAELPQLLKPLRDLQEQAEQLGLTLTDHDVAAAQEFTEQSDLLGQAVDRLKDRIGEEFLPVLTQVVEFFSKSEIFADAALAIDAVSGAVHELAIEQEILTGVPAEVWWAQQKSKAEAFLAVLTLMPGGIGSVSRAVVDFGTAWEKARAAMLAAQQSQADQQRALDVWYQQTQAQTKALGEQLAAQDKADAAAYKTAQDFAKAQEDKTNAESAANEKLETFLAKLWHDYYEEKTKEQKQTDAETNADLQVTADAEQKIQETLTAASGDQFAIRLQQADDWMEKEIGKVKIVGDADQTAFLAIAKAHGVMVDQITQDQEDWYQQQRDDAQQVVGIWQSAFESLPQILMDAFEGGGNLEGAMKSFATKLATTLSSSLANSSAYGAFVNNLGNLFGAGFSAFLKSTAGRDLISGALSGLAYAGVSRIAQSGTNGVGSGLVGAGELAGSVGASTALVTGSAATAAEAGAATFGVGAAVVAGIAAYEAHKNDTQAARSDFATQLGYNSLADLYTDLQSKGTQGQALANTGLNVIGKHDSTANNAWMQQVTDFLTTLTQRLATATTNWQNFDQAASSLGVTLPSDLDTIVAKLEKLGTSDAVDALGEGFTKAQDALADYQSEVDKTNAFKTVEQEMSDVGLTADDMNGKFKQMKDEETARTLAQEWQDLAPYVNDVNVLAGKFGDQIEGMVKDSMDAGVAIPESMKPIIQSLIDQGKLVDDNGDKITDMSKLTFEKDPLQEALDTLNDTMKDLDDWLKNKLPQDLSDLGKTTVSPTVDVGVTYHYNDPGPGAQLAQPDIPVADAPIRRVTRSGLVRVNPGDIVGMPHLTPGYGGGVHFGDIHVHGGGSDARSLARELRVHLTKEMQGAIARGELAISGGAVRQNVSAR
jgi:hypothetical protein